MKIQGIKVNFVRLPLEERWSVRPICPACCANSSRCSCRPTRASEGLGVTGFGGKLVRALRAALDDLGELIKGDDPLRTEQVNAKLRAASASCGSGIAMLAISAIDT